MVSCFCLGVVTRDFELSSQPNLGTWKITVEVDVSLFQRIIKYLYIPCVWLSET